MTFNFDEYLAEESEQDVNIQEPSGTKVESIDFNQYLETSDNGLFPSHDRYAILQQLLPHGSLVVKDVCVPL